MRAEREEKNYTTSLRLNIKSKKTVYYDLSGQSKFELAFQ